MKKKKEHVAWATKIAKHLRNYPNAHSTIQAAINSLPKNPGGLVYVDEGTFEESVEIKSNVTLQGAGQQSIVKLPVGYTDTLYATGKTNVHFKDLFIDGNVANQNPDVGDTHSGISLVNCSGITVQGVKGTNIGGVKCHGYVVQLMTCSDYCIENVYGENLDCVVAVNSSSKGTIRNIRAKDWCTVDPYAGIVWVGAFGADTKDVAISDVRGVQTGSYISKGVGLHLTADNGYKLSGVTFNGIYAEESLDGASLVCESVGGSDPNTALHDVVGSNIVAYHTHRHSLWVSGETTGKLYGVNIFGVRGLQTSPTEHNVMIGHAVDSTFYGIDVEGAVFETLEVSYCYRCTFQGRLKNPQRHAFACWDTMQDCVIDIEATDNQSPHTMQYTVYLYASTSIDNYIHIRRDYGAVLGSIGGDATALTQNIIDTQDRIWRRSMRFGFFYPTNTKIIELRNLSELGKLFNFRNVTDNVDLLNILSAGQIEAYNIIQTRLASGTIYFGGFSGTEVYSRIALTNLGIVFGPGSADWDVSLTRSATHKLSTGTNDDFSVGKDFSVGGDTLINKLTTLDVANVASLQVAGVNVISGGALLNLTFGTGMGEINDTIHGSRGSGLHSDSHARSHSHALAADNNWITPGRIQPSIEYVAPSGTSGVTANVSVRKGDDSGSMTLNFEKGIFIGTSG